MLFSMVDEREDQQELIKKYGQKSAVKHHGMLCIRLRTPKDEEQEVGDEEDRATGYHQWEDQIQDDQPPSDLTRFCHVCHKGFRSGKALGGHMRIHFQGHKEPIFNKKLKPSQSNKFRKLKLGEEVTDVVKKKISNKSTDGAAAGFDKIPTCLCCGKSFRSMKSLFGHMRCHPGRDWRGIHPPPQYKNSSSSSVSDVELQKSDDQEKLAASYGDQADDLTKSLRGWPATAKRGRKINMGNSCSEEEDEEFRIAARELIRLAHGDSFESGLTSKQRVEEFEATNSNSLTYKAETEDTKRFSESKKRSFAESSVGCINVHPLKQLRNEGGGLADDGKVEGFRPNGVISMGDFKAAKETDFLAGKSVTVDSRWEDTNWPGVYEDKNCSESGSKNTEQLNHKNYGSTNGKETINAENMNKKKKKRKKMKLKDLESVHHASPVHQNQATLTTRATRDKFKCSTCDACFTTHQALGGHKSSHNKFRMVIQNSDDEKTYAADEVHKLADSPIPMDQTKESEEAASSKQLDSPHQCKICKKIFSSGQALGGHKRCHWTGPMEAQSSQGEVSHTDGRVLVFDLNEVPPPEDDAGIDSVHVAGCGHASSSDTSIELSSL